MALTAWRGHGITHQRVHEDRTATSIGVGPSDRRCAAWPGQRLQAATPQARVGQLQLAVPQVRGAKFYPSVLERGSRSEKMLRLALAEMYVQGVFDQQGHEDH